MRTVIQCLSAVIFLNGCSIFGGKKTISNWEALESAVSVTCEQFPQPPSVLRIRDLHILEGKMSGVVADVVLRTGQGATFYTPFISSPEFEVENMAKRDFGSGAIILGGAGINKGVYVALLQQSKGKSKLELRTLPDNIVRFTSDETNFKALAGDAFVTEHGIWVAYKVDAEDTSEEDAQVGVVFFSFGKNDRLVTSKFDRYKFPPDAKLLTAADRRKAYMVWSATGKDRKTHQFFMTELDPSKQFAEDPKRIELPVTSEVESWAASSYGDSIMLAIIDGDSLVGRAKLMISRVYWRGEYTKVGWKRESSLTNIHVSEPVWLNVGKRAKLMLPKWVDGESTVGLYSVSPDGVVKQSSVGIFPKGSRVMTGFRDQTENDNYVVMRYRNKGAWQFEICNLEDN